MDSLGQPLQIHQQLPPRSAIKATLVMQICMIRVRACNLEQFQFGCTGWSTASAVYLLLARNRGFSR